MDIKRKSHTQTFLLNCTGIGASSTYIYVLHMHFYLSLVSSSLSLYVPPSPQPLLLIFLPPTFMWFFWTDMSYCLQFILLLTQDTDQPRSSLWTTEMATCTTHHWCWRDGSCWRWMARRECWLGAHQNMWEQPCSKCTTTSGKVRQAGISWIRCN